jgi:hypothetical protein
MIKITGGKQLNTTAFCTKPQDYCLNKASESIYAKICHKNQGNEIDQPFQFHKKQTSITNLSQSGENE